MIRYCLIFFSCLSFNLFAGTGSANDHIFFTLGILGILSGIIGFISIVEFIGKKIRKFFEEMIDNKKINFYRITPDLF